MNFTRTKSGFFMAKGAVITGDTSIGEDSSVWFNAVIRGDVAPIVIGRCVNLQDGAVIHCDTDFPNGAEPALCPAVRESMSRQDVGSTPYQTLVFYGAPLHALSVISTG